MRDLLAATAVAADLVLVPIQAKLEPLAFAVQTDSNANAPSQTTAAQSDQTPQRAALDAFAPSPSASGSGSDGDKDPAAVPPNSAAATETSADAI